MMQVVVPMYSGEQISTRARRWVRGRGRSWTPESALRVCSLRTSGHRPHDPALFLSCDPSEQRSAKCEERLLALHSQRECQVVFILFTSALCCVRALTKGSQTHCPGDSAKRAGGTTGLLRSWSPLRQQSPSCLTSHPLLRQHTHHMMSSCPTLLCAVLQIGNEEGRRTDAQRRQH